jgi:hypothetical protein
MNQKHSLFLCFALLLWNPSIAQNIEEEPEEPQYKNTFIFAPLNLFDFINPSFQIGYERTFTNHISLQLEGGPILKRSLSGLALQAIEYYEEKNGTDKKRYWWTYSGYKIRGEIKYYFKDSRNNRKNPYISCELFYTENRSNVDDRYKASDPTYDYSQTKAEFIDSSNYYTDYYSILKQRMGLNIKLGVQLALKRHRNIIFEPHIGLGIVYRKMKEFNRANINDQIVDDIFNKKGDRWLINIPLNIKIGYRF